MRSRYSAYVRGAIDYLVATHDPRTRDRVDVPAITRWSRETEWLGLEIVATEHGEAGDDTGIVEFIASGRTRGAAFRQHERSRFRRVDPTAPPFGGADGRAHPTVDGPWMYTDGEVMPVPPVRLATPPGRNDPCPCGSGRKYKRCHG